MIAETRTDQNERLSLQVINSVARYRKVDPLDLPPLIESVEADSLDRLLSSCDGFVQFTYAGCKVTAYSDGRVEVTDT